MRLSAEIQRLVSCVVVRSHPLIFYTCQIEGRYALRVWRRSRSLLAAPGTFGRTDIWRARNLSPATAAPLRLPHARPAAQRSVRSVSRRAQRLYGLRFTKTSAMASSASAPELGQGLSPPVRTLVQSSVPFSPFHSPSQILTSARWTVESLRDRVSGLSLTRASRLLSASWNQRRTVQVSHRPPDAFRRPRGAAEETVGGRPRRIAAPIPIPTRPIRCHHYCSGTSTLMSERGILHLGRETGTVTRTFLFRFAVPFTRASPSRPRSRCWPRGAIHPAPCHGPASGRTCGARGSGSC